MPGAALPDLLFEQIRAMRAESFEVLPHRGQRSCALCWSPCATPVLATDAGPDWPLMLPVSQLTVNMPAGKGGGTPLARSGWPADRDRSEAGRPALAGRELAGRRHPDQHAGAHRPGCPGIAGGQPAPGTAHRGPRLGRHRRLPCMNTRCGSGNRDIAPGGPRRRPGSSEPAFARAAILDHRHQGRASHRGGVEQAARPRLRLGADGLAGGGRLVEAQGEVVVM